MKERVNFMLVGLFVLALSGALIAGVLWLGAGGPKPDRRLYVTYMTESVYGLSKDSAVTYRGVEVGRVRDIGLDPQNSERVRLLLEIRASTPVREDTVTVLETQGLTGLAHVNLEGGSSAGPPLQTRAGEDHPVIRNRPSALASWDTTAARLLDGLNDVSQRIARLLDDRNLEQVNETLEHLRAGSASLQAAMERIDRDVVARLPVLVDQLRTSAASVEQMAGQISGAASALEGVVRRSGEDVERFTAQALPETTALVVELRQAAQNLRRFSEELERSPQVLLQGPPQRKRGPGE